MYAERKGLALQDVSVELQHERIHAKDCEDCEQTSGYLDQIQTRIELTGDLSQQEKDRLLEIAGKCPVHRTLTSEVRIQTEMA